MGFLLKLRHSVSSSAPSYSQSEKQQAKAASQAAEIERIEDEIWPDEASKQIAHRYQEVVGLAHVRDDNPRVRRSAQTRRALADSAVEIPQVPPRGLLQPDPGRMGE
jgi:hypothetical protein